MKTFKLFAVSGLVAAACISSAIAADTAQPSKRTVHFIQNAVIGGKFEVDSSQIALQKSQNNDVKIFAQHMVDDHTKANDELKNTVASENIDPSVIPADLDAKHQGLIDKLNADTGTEFDRDYIKAQQDAHKGAVALFAKYSKNGDDAALKTFAANTLPTLQEHKAMAAKLKAGQ